MKMPLFVPTKCGENELLYPGDYNNDWVCDCKPGLLISHPAKYNLKQWTYLNVVYCSSFSGFLFYPATSKCYGPYYQGPCQPGSMLILKPNSYIPECAVNPCRIGDGYVRFRNGCHKLETPGPCAQPELSIVLSVNVSNLQLDCVKIGAPSTPGPLADRFGGDDDDVVVPAEVNADVMDDLCAVGSRRWQERKCPPKNEWTFEIR